jgi:hypothetical protein
MSAPARSLAALRWLAAVAAAAGFAGAAWAIRVVPARLRLIERKEADLRALVDLERESRALDPYFAALAAATGGPPESPAAILQQAAPGAPAPTIAAGTSEPLEGGWTFRRMEVSFADVPVDSFAAFLSACASARPPWRAAQVRIQALDPGSTRARVALTLEGVEGAAPSEARKP